MWYINQILQYNLIDLFNMLYKCGPSFLFLFFPCLVFRLLCAGVKNRGLARKAATAGAKGKPPPQPSVSGVPVMTMTVAALRKHVRDMGLKPSGHLKADLQRCLCDHLLEAQQAKPADAPFIEIREGRAESVETIALSPNRVLFRGIPVADMEPDTMRAIMKDLDVPCRGRARRR